MSAGASLGRTAILGAGGPTSGPTAESEPKAQSNFTDPREPDHEDQQRGVPAVLQRADGGRWGAPDHPSRLRWGHRPATRVTAGGDATPRSSRRLGSSLRWYSPMRATATSRICWSYEDRGIDAHVALGREGKSQVAVDPARLPATHRRGQKLTSPAGKARYAQRKWLSEAPNGWIKEVHRIPTIQPARLGEGCAASGTSCPWR